MYNFKIFEIIAENVEETQRAGRVLANYLQPATVIALEGELGAGKTVFAQGLAKGLGVKQIVNSPTYTLIKEYMGRIPLYHMDVYRLSEGIEDLGFSEYFFGEGVTVVEWASIIEEYLPKKYLKVNISKLDDQRRKISFTPYGQEYKRICREYIEDENLVD